MWQNIYLERRPRERYGLNIRTRGGNEKNGGDAETPNDDDNVVPPLSVDIVIKANTKTRGGRSRRDSITSRHYACVLNESDHILFLFIVRCPGGSGVRGVGGQIEPNEDRSVFRLDFGLFVVLGVDQLRDDLPRVARRVVVVRVVADLFLGALLAAVRRMHVLLHFVIVVLVLVVAVFGHFGFVCCDGMKTATHHRRRIDRH